MAVEDGEEDGGLENRRSLASRLAAILEEQNLRGGLISVVKTKGAVAARVVLRHAATGAAAVHLVDAEMVADVELAPRLDEDGAAGFFREQRLQRRSFVLDVGDRSAASIS